MTDYYWICSDSRRYYEGWRFKTLRTARRGAYRHLIATNSVHGYSEVVLDSRNSIKYVGTVHCDVLNGKRVIFYYEDFNPAMKMYGRKWHLRSDGTLGRRCDDGN